MLHQLTLSILFTLTLAARPSSCDNARRGPLYRGRPMHRVLIRTFSQAETMGRNLQQHRILTHVASADLVTSTHTTAENHSKGIASTRASLRVHVQWQHQQNATIKIGPLYNKPLYIYCCANFFLHYRTPASLCGLEEGEPSSCHVSSAFMPMGNGYGCTTGVPLAGEP